MTGGYAGNDPPSADTIRTWLVERLSAALKVDPGAVDIEGSLLDSGLDSLTAVALVADLEDWLGIELEATLIWDHPTVAQLTSYIRSAIHARAGEGHGSLELGTG